MISYDMFRFLIFFPLHIINQLFITDELVDNCIEYQYLKKIILFMFKIVLANFYNNKLIKMNIIRIIQKKY